jgi:hypothetical protein
MNYCLIDHVAGVLDWRTERIAEGSIDLEAWHRFNQFSAWHQLGEAQSEAGDGGILLGLCAAPSLRVVEPWPAHPRRERLAFVKVQRERAAAAAAAPAGVSIEAAGDYCTVTFAEKPEREILDALKAAGFRWGKGSWSGRRDKLPSEIETP